jgi:hypothetical protein
MRVLHHVQISDLRLAKAKYIVILCNLHNPRLVHFPFYFPKKE